MNNDPYYNFCLEEIRFYTEKINEIIKEGLKDPKKYYEESKSEWKKIYQMIPVMYMMNQIDDEKILSIVIYLTSKSVLSDVGKLIRYPSVNPVNRK